MLNALPSSIASQVERIEKAIAAWPISISLDHAVKWVLQFDREDYGLGIRILEHVDVLSQADVRSAFDIAKAKLERAAAEKGKPIVRGNTLYAGVGHAAKSGALMAYHYRLTAGVAANDFFVQEEGNEIDFSWVDNIVLLDDVIATGRTVEKDVASIVLMIHGLVRTRNVFVLTVAGYESGITQVVEKTGASVIAALEYSSRDTVVDVDAAFYAGLPMSERARTLDRIKRYCRICSVSNPSFALGYGDIGGLLVFDHNTPNTTLPLLWDNGNGWKPLFPRAVPIRGVGKVLRAAKNEEEHFVKDGSAAAYVHVPRKSAELTIFVEGKYDEVFVDVMRNQLHLASLLEIGDVKAVSLGGLMHSTKLAEVLRSTGKYAVFVLDGDSASRRATQNFPEGLNTRVLYLTPNFAALLDIDKVYADADRFPRLPNYPGNGTDERWFRAFETAVLRRGPVTANSARLAQTIEEYLDPKAYQIFVQELKKLVDDLFPI
jgi:hypothetical protein